MVRISKKAEERQRSPRKRRAPSAKTGPKKDQLPLGYKEQPNALSGEFAKNAFIPKIR